MNEYIDEAITASQDQTLCEAYDKNIALREDAIEDGIEIGRRDGIHEGILSTARNMLKDHLDINTIKKYTGLDALEINRLKLELEEEA